MSAPAAGRRGLRPSGPERVDALTVAASAGTIMLVSAAAAAVQTAWVQDVLGHAGGDVPTMRRLVANIVQAAAVAGALVALGTHRRRGTARRLAAVAGAAAVGSALRLATQWALGLLSGASVGTWLLQLGAGVPMSVASGCFALLALRVQRRARTEAGAAARASLARETAMGALADEEVRVRREVAEGLHGTAQQRLVLVVAGLDQVLRELDGTAGAHVTDQLRDLRDKVETVRAADIRGASRLLYPHQIEVGLVAAVRGLLADVPACVATRLTVDPAVRALDEPGSCRTTRGERLLAARVVEEAVANAVRHGGATALEVTVALDGARVAVVVADDGSGLRGGGGMAVAGGEVAADEGAAGEGSGLARLAERLGLAGGELQVGPGLAGGVVVRALVPVAALAAQGR